MNRAANDDGQDAEGSAAGLPLTFQALRAADEGIRGVANKAKAADDEKMSLFWRVFGGTILSIGALVALTMYNNLSATLSDLRSAVEKANEARAAAVVGLQGELAKAAEARADLLRKEEYNTRMTTLGNRLMEWQTQTNAQNATLTSAKTELDGIKERLTRLGTDLDAVRKDTAVAVEGLRKESTAALDGVRKDQLSTTEAIKKDVAALELVKERVATVCADLKVVQADQGKLRTDVDQNHSSDLVRRDRRDAQVKQMDDAMKELTKALQDCREKLARLEGQYTPPSPVTQTGGTSPAKKEPARTAIPKTDGE